MKTFISLLRGINVSGQNRINMPDLKRLYESLGMTNVVTYIQSGNVVFNCAEKNSAKIQEIIEEGISHTFQCDVRVILRDMNELEKVWKSNTYLISRHEDPGKLYVTFLSKIPTNTIGNNPITAVPQGGYSAKDGGGRGKNPPPPDPRPSSTPHGVDTADGGLKPPQLRTGEKYIVDEFIIRDKEVYLFCPNGYGKTKFSNTFFEKKLNVSATTRNWKTVNALFEIAERR
jgi:uncharacterized protein (DUF1697 family)